MPNIWPNTVSASCCCELSPLHSLKYHAGITLYAVICSKSLRIFREGYNLQIWVINVIPNQHGPIWSRKRRNQVTFLLPFFMIHCGYTYVLPACNRYWAPDTFQLWD
ncbi:hypothetical protein OG21DRAFT_1512901, partial [Imleria badia]